MSDPIQQLGETEAVVPQGAEPAPAVGDYALLLRRYNDLVEMVIPIGAALFGEKDYDRLLEQILIQTQQLCNADGGTLYMVEDDQSLRFAMARNRSLGFAYGGKANPAPPFPPLPLRDPQTGQENHANAASYVALTGHTLAIDDVYAEQRFDFSGARRFDQDQGYITRSLLSVAITNASGKVLGVLQMINAVCRDTGRIIAFDEHLRRAVEALALLAGSALEAYVRDRELRSRIQSLSIRIDGEQRQSEVAQITSTDYFQNLSAKARKLRTRYGQRHEG